MTDLISRLEAAAGLLLVIFLVLPCLMILMLWDQTVGRVQLWWFWRKPRQRHYCLPPPPDFEPVFDGPKSWPWSKQQRSAVLKAHQESP